MKRLMPLLLLFLSGALFYMHIDPRYMEVRKLAEQKAQYEEALVKAQELVSVRDELLSKYNALPKEDLAKLERLIPTNLNTVKLITDLSSIGGPYGIALRGIEVSESIEDSAQQVSDTVLQKPYQTREISFSFTANYQNLVGFLKDIEKSLQLVDVKSVSFTAKDDSSLYDYDVTIQTYWLK